MDTINSSIYNIDLKYKLMRVDNNLDFENSIESIFDIYNIDKEIFKVKVEEIVKCYIVKKTKVLNILGVNAFNKQLYDLSIFMLRLSYSIDTNDLDTIYNLSYILYDMKQYDIATNILVNISDDAKKDKDIQVLMKLLEEKMYE